MENKVFKRKIFKKMLQWKTESDGKTALLIEGARRVGKSTVVEEFARSQYKSYIIIDFNRSSAETKGLFEDLTDLDMLFLKLQATYHVQLFERQSVIVFDEVQSFPLARQAIKYLVADGRYDYIETGSLISIKKNTENITIPSEEDRLQMYPMDYEEFRWALGDEVTIPLLKTFLNKRKPLANSLRTAMRDLRLYMLVGGMPQAVLAYLQTNNLQQVDKVKRKIIQLYDDDFQKIDTSGRISKLFKSIPVQLYRNVSRYVPMSVIGETGKDKLTELVKVMEDSKTVNMVYRADDPCVGMGLTQDLDRYKLFLADTGLFVTLAFWDKDYTENEIYNKLLNGKLSANLGYVYENLVAQMLVAAGNRLFYYTWKKDEKHNYEIDFLISRGAKICPIEVKSSGTKSHVSIDRFNEKFKERIACSYIITTKDYHEEEGSKNVFIPVCMTSLL